MASVTPYDVVIFVVVLLIWLLVVGVCACLSFRRWHQQQQQPKTYDDEAVTPTAAAPAPQQESFAKRLLLFSLVGLAGVAVSYIITIILFAILGSAGMADVLLFSPKADTDCVSSCTYTAKDGLEGWVDETCCTYNPHTTEDGQTLTPQDVWIGFDSANPKYGIHGWLFVNETKSHPVQPRTVILYSHGSGMNVGAGYRWKRYEYFLSLGNVAILAYDYPDYGKSTSKPSGSSSEEYGVYVANSALFAGRWLSDWEKATAVAGSGATINYGSEASPVSAPTSAADVTDLSNIFVLGRSMGGSVAAYVGWHVSWKVKGLILQSAFSSIYDVSTFYFPMSGWVLGSMAASNYPQFDTIKSVSTNTDGCAYHSHSKDDEWVPFRMAEEIDAALPPSEQNPPKWDGCGVFLVQTGVIHTQPLTIRESLALQQWLASRAGPK